MQDPEPNFPSPRINPLYAGGNFEGMAPVAKARLWDGRPVWLVTRFNDARKVLHDYKIFSRRPSPSYPFISPARSATLTTEAPMFPRMDPPDHPKFQRMVAFEFTARRVAKLKTRMEEIVDSILDGFEAKGPPVDIFHDLGLVMPTTVIAEMLGIPVEDHAFINDRSQYRFNGDVTAEVATKALEELLEYTRGQFKLREEGQDTDDVIGRLVKNYVKPGHIDREQAVQTVELLIAGGHETTANMITMGTLLFLQHPDQAQLLRERPELIGSAVHELLRYLTVNQSVGAAVCLVDTVIAGQEIKAGDGVFACLPAANTDASEFPDPDRFDITRDPVQHMAFGSGPHRCLGANLADLELAVVFSKLFTRFPTLKLAIPFDEIAFKHGNMVFGVKSLPVTW